MFFGLQVIFEQWQGELDEDRFIFLVFFFFGVRCIFKEREYRSGMEGKIYGVEDGLGLFAERYRGQRRWDEGQGVRGITIASWRGWDYGLLGVECFWKESLIRGKCSTIGVSGQLGFENTWYFFGWRCFLGLGEMGGNGIFCF